MDGERSPSRERRDEGAVEVGGAEDGAVEQVYARPEWLDEFADPPRGGRADDDDDLWDPEPTGWRSTVERVRTTPRAAVALIVVGVLAAIIAAVAVSGPADEAVTGQYPVVNFAGSSTSQAPPVSGTQSTRAPSGADASSTAVPTEMVVAVVGLVRAPGLHRLPVGARVADALAAARGATRGADTAGLNLAQPLRDGDQVIVGVAEGSSGLRLRSSVVSGARAAGGEPVGASTGTEALVNINTAAAAELDRLPGVGVATAAAIITYREQHGPFASVDDLANVTGIGPAKLAKIKPMATV